MAKLHHSGVRRTSYNVIKISKIIKCLGVTMDSNLTFRSHIFLLPLFLLPPPPPPPVSVRFKNFDSDIPVGVIRVKSCVGSFVHSSDVPLKARSINVTASQREW